MTEQNDAPEVIAYFGGWRSYKIPFVPQEAITQIETTKRTSYYVGYYQGQQLIRFEKYLNGALEWSDTYVYWNNGKLRTRHMTRDDGSETVQQFDRRGRIIK